VYFDVPVYPDDRFKGINEIGNSQSSRINITDWHCGSMFCVHAFSLCYANKGDAQPYNLVCLFKKTA
jgi:hypothetical protein